jgi:hypothetical protein
VRAFDQYGKSLSRYPDELHCHFILADDGETQAAGAQGMDMMDEQRKGVKSARRSDQGQCRVKSTQLNLLDYATRETPVQLSEFKVQGIKNLKLSWLVPLAIKLALQPPL